MRKHCTLALSALTAAVIAVTTPALAASYTPVDLGAFHNGFDTAGGIFVFSGATAINENGAVVGHSVKQLPDNSVVTRPFLWTSANGMQDLGTIGYTKGIAADINNQNQVVGYASNTGVGTPTTLSSATSGAFIWDVTNGIRALPGLGGTGPSVPLQARAINDAGNIVGYARDATGKQTVITWNAANIASGTNLAAYLGTTTLTTDAFGLDVNNAGTLLIETDTNFAGNNTAPAWVGGVLVPQAGNTYAPVAITGTSVFPRALNSNGLVTGYKTNAAFGYDAFVWNTATQALTILPSNGFTYVQAHGINDNGDVVGVRSNGSGNSAFLYTNGITYALNDLLAPGSGWNIFGADDINNAGQIAATGSNPLGQSHAVLLNGGAPDFSLKGASANGAILTGTGTAGLAAGDAKVGDPISLTNFVLSDAFATLSFTYDLAEIQSLGLDPASLRLYWYDTSTNTWTLAGNGSNNIKNPAAQFVLGAPDNVLGDWGVDLANNVVWANVDHASAYGIIGQAVPEPASLTILGLGAALLFRRKR